MLKENLIEKLKEENENLIKICADFDLEDNVASKIEIISDLLNVYFADDEFLPEHLRAVTYSMTRLITFLAHLHESVSYSRRLEQRISNPAEN